jgi:nitrate/nitrite transporter NarK
VSIWFYYGEISFATALSGCLGKMGSVTADIVTPMVFRSSGSITKTFWIAALINITSLVIVLILNFVD